MTSTRRMASVEAFDITMMTLGSVLDDIQNGRTRLPHFHREWCWPSDHIRSLLGSIAEGHPIGSVMFVNAVPLGHRSFDGVGAADPNTTPLHLVLDGQQRLTAAYQACFARAVRVRSDLHPEYCRYFFDMREAISSAFPVEDAIFSVATNRDGGSLNHGDVDFTDPSVQYERCIFPVNMTFDFDAYDRQYSEFWDEKEYGPERSDALSIWRHFRTAVASAFKTYRLPVQTLKRPTSVAALCRVYEHVNMPRKSAEFVE
ncbi:DUF262 domain-containing protein [Tardiphaga sp. 604_B6_N1_1]|uniref:DUF262 domain-containing protein n=1 Tax=unclassified Tardiphaga TaxID=2631404 RepID=UPI003F20CAD6